MLPDDAPIFEPDEAISGVPEANSAGTASAAGTTKNRRSRAKKTSSILRENDASIYGERVPPHSAEAEQGLLSAIILSEGGDVLNDCQAAKIVPETFFRTEHQIVYEAISNLGNAGKPIEPTSLQEELKRLGKLEDVGGVRFLLDLAGKASSTIHAAHWREIIKEKYFRRKLISTAAQTAESAFSDGDDIKNILDRVEKSFFAIAGDNIQETTLSTSSRRDGAIIPKTISILQQMLRQRGAISGVPSGFSDLDAMTFGFHPGQMIVVAARPGMGKTSIALNFIEAALFDKTRERQNLPPRNVLLFSLEMTAEDLVQRLLASKSRVNLRNLQKGFGKSDDISALGKASEEYQKRNLFIDDVGGQTIMEIRAKARRIHSRTKLDLIVIDYLQLINGTDSRMPREQQIAEASRSIKAMAKEFGVPVIALAQLNRESDKEDRKPRPSDLRESGSIEQDADVIMLIDIRRGQSKKSATEEEEDKMKQIRERTLIIAKQRNGPTGEIPLHFLSNLTRFETPAKIDVSEPEF